MSTLLSKNEYDKTMQALALADKNTWFEALLHDPTALNDVKNCAYTFYIISGKLEKAAKIDKISLQGFKNLLVIYLYESNNSS